MIAIITCWSGPRLSWQARSGGFVNVQGHQCGTPAAQVRVTGRGHGSIQRRERGSPREVDGEYLKGFRDHLVDNPLFTPAGAIS